MVVDVVGRLVKMPADSELKWNSAFVVSAAVSVLYKVSMLLAFEMIKAFNELQLGKAHHSMRKLPHMRFFLPK